MTDISVTLIITSTPTEQSTYQVRVAADSTVADIMTTAGVSCTAPPSTQGTTPGSINGVEGTWQLYVVPEEGILHKAPQGMEYHPSDGDTLNWIYK